MFIKKYRYRYRDFICIYIAPGQNRTDASSLEGYSSTTELQAQESIIMKIELFLCNTICEFFLVIFKNLDPYNVRFFGQARTCLLL